MEYAELTQVYPTWKSICQENEEQKKIAIDYHTKLVINKYIVNPGERLRIVDGELEVDHRSSFMRTFSKDSRYSLLKFLQKNKTLLTKKMFVHLKNLYKNDSKFISSLEKEFGILKIDSITSNIVSSSGANDSNSKISLKKINFSSNYKEHGKLRIINDKIERDNRPSFMRMFSRDSRWSLLQFLKRNINANYIYNGDHYLLFSYLNDFYNGDSKFQEKLIKIDEMVNFFKRNKN